MKTLFIECNMGAAGDMLMAALSGLIENRDGFFERMNSLGLEGVKVWAEASEKCGITGTHVNVTVNGEHEHSHDYSHGHTHGDHDHDHGHTHEHTHDGHTHTHPDGSKPSGENAVLLKKAQGHDHSHNDEHGHAHGHGHSRSGMSGITETIMGLPVSDRVKLDAAAVYRLIADAEARAHGKPVEQIHFHEVGTYDAIADIVGVCMLMEEINPDKIVVSPVHVGSGQVRCAHGILPVPAPATADILRGVPIYGGEIRGELCTPTGAALLKHFADEFGAMPRMTADKLGIGMGKKDFPQANCLRVFAGDSGAAAGKAGPDDIYELTCNLDDMTPEAVGYAFDILMEAGAPDVFLTPIHMKKNRPAVMLTCLCKPEDCDKFAELILRHTTTRGVRKTFASRYVLSQQTSEVDSKYGKIRVKTSGGFGVEKIKAEYDDVSAAARRNNVTLDAVYSEIDRLIQKSSIL
ncbi:MAG: nickel pincer cofactor biosynthesis protein LarC [Oscillospiraceae bacterium]|jgi:uncharacterized protein (TIGR00299 family) protein|nr:nickel pincer cofactor biosynthesis protein LarC [Oscillospiraceae bacterium]